MNLLKGFTKRFKSKKNTTFKKEEYIYRDWILSFLFFIIAVLGVVAVAVYMFLSVKNIEATENLKSSDTLTNIIDQELLIETINFYTKKEETYNSIQTDFEGAPGI